MRTHYWTCSKFADWLRGTPKPKSETGPGWTKWYAEAEGYHPVRYWLAEEGLSILQNIVMWPTDKLYSLKYYLNNRFVTKTHALTAHPRDIKRGEWCDVGNRFLPCLFNELVDFVEIELAWWNICWSDKDKRAQYDTPWWATGWWRVRAWRSPQSGMDNLNWQAQLRHDEEYHADTDYYGTFTQQALNAQEMIALYTWWTVTRPARPDPHDASGWSAICEARRAKADAEGKRRAWLDFEDRTPEDRKASADALEICHRMEAEYEKEDEDMMIRLIKVRNGLWT